MKNAPAAENRACWPEVQVDTGRDVRWHQPRDRAHTREQVVHVAAVAGHINNFMAVMRQLANALGVMDVNALIEAVPCKARMRSERRIIS